MVSSIIQGFWILVYTTSYLRFAELAVNKPRQIICSWSSKSTSENIDYTDKRRGIPLYSDSTINFVIPITRA
jgi:hypothetical protein